MKYLSSLILHSLLCFLALEALAAKPVSQKHTLLVFGDSLSAGYGLENGEDWPTLLQHHLMLQGFQNTKVINASLSGETTAGGKERLPALLKAHKPDIVILELGANDGLRGLSLRQMRSNLKTMMEDIVDANARVVLVGMHLPPNYGKRYTKNFNEIYRKLGKQKDVFFIPFLLEGIAQKPSMFQKDQLHPKAHAQPIIMRNIFRSISPLLLAGKSD